MTEAIKKHWVVVFGIFLLALVLRTFGLSSRLPVFVDEAIYIRWAQVMRADETLRFLPLTDGKQPLFMWLVIPFLKFFNDPLFAGRFVSVLAGLGIVAGAGFVSLKVFRSRRMAMMVLLLAATCPFLVFFDRKALVDSLLSFWGVMVLGLGLLFVESPRLDLALLLGFALGGGWLTKTPGELYFLLLPTTLLSVKKKSVREKSFWVRLFSGFLVAFVLGLGIYNILRLGPNFHMIGLRNQDYVYSVREVLSHPLVPLVGNLQAVVGWWFVLLAPPALLLAVVGVFWMLIEMPLAAVMLAAWSIGPVVLEAMVGKVFTARYVLFAMPELVIICAYGLDKLVHHLKSIKAIVALVVIAPLFFEDYLLVAQPARAWLPRVERSGYLEEWTAGYGLTEIANYLKSRPGGTKILVGTEGFFGTTPDGLEIYLEGRSNIRVIGLAFPIKETPVSLTSALGDNEVYLVANRSRFQIVDPQEQGLFLVSSFTRPARPDGSEETLLFFRVKPVLLTK